MNKLKFRVLIASVMIPCNLYSGPVFSMNDGQLNLIKKDQNLDEGEKAGGKDKKGAKKK